MDELSGARSERTRSGNVPRCPALVDKAVGGANFEGLAVVAPGLSYLSDLGVNALELLPPADSFFKREWGYDTAHFLAPHHDLGFPEGNTSSTANADIAAPVVACHQHGIRFFVDMVMAFGRVEPYQTIDFDNFCIEDAKDHREDPDALTSGRADGHQDIRDGFGSTLFRYTRELRAPAYDPISGQNAVTVPAHQHMYSYLTPLDARHPNRWHTDGQRRERRQLGLHSRFQESRARSLERALGGTGIGRGPG